MKRKNPLFIFDLTRQHKFGEVDFVSVMDKDNCFVAKISYISGDINEADDNSKTVSNGNGMSARMEIVQFLGQRRDNGAVRTLLAKAMEQYVQYTVKPIDIDSPSDADMIAYLNMLIKGNRSQLSHIGSDVKNRAIVMSSLKMLEHIMTRISGDKQEQ